MKLWPGLIFQQQHTQMPEITQATPRIFTDVTGNYNITSGTISNTINQKDLDITASDNAKCFEETLTFFRNRIYINRISWN